MKSKSRFTLFILFIVLAFHSGCQFQKQPEEKLLVFSAMGCGPYNERSKEALKHYIKMENHGDSRFIAYLGDLFPGRYGKTLINQPDKGEKDYREIANILSTNNNKPTFVLPGDNETIDRKDPEVGFELWHKYFDRFYKNFKKTTPVTHQKDRLENFSFVTQDVLVVGIHKVGAKKMEGPYWDKTLGSALDWISKNLKENHKTKTAIILAHAGIQGKGFQEKLFSAIRQYKKPVIYIHADGHKWFEKQYPDMNNFHHIQLDLIYSKNLKNGPFYPPTQFTITGDPSRPYLYNRRLNSAEWKNF